MATATPIITAGNLNYRVVTSEYPPAGNEDGKQTANRIDFVWYGKHTFGNTTPRGTFISLQLTTGTVYDREYKKVNKSQANVLHALDLECPFPYWIDDVALRVHSLKPEELDKQFIPVTTDIKEEVKGARSISRRIGEWLKKTKECSVFTDEDEEQFIFVDDYEEVRRELARVREIALAFDVTFYWV